MEKGGGNLRSPPPGEAEPFDHDGDHLFAWDGTRHHSRPSSSFDLPPPEESHYSPTELVPIFLGEGLTRTPISTRLRGGRSSS